MSLLLNLYICPQLFSTFNLFETMAELKQYLRTEIDRLQMNVVKQLNNIDEIKAVLGTFERMNDVLNEAPEISLNVGAGGEDKPKRTYKKRNKAE